MYKNIKFIILHNYKNFYSFFFVITFFFHNKIASVYKVHRSRQFHTLFQMFTVNFRQAMMINMYHSEMMTNTNLRYSPVAVQCYFKIMIYISTSFFKLQL